MVLYVSFNTSLKCSCMWFSGKVHGFSSAGGGTNTVHLSLHMKNADFMHVEVIDLKATIYFYDCFPLAVVKITTSADTSSEI